MKDVKFEREYVCEWVGERSNEEVTTRKDILSWLNTVALRDHLIKNILEHYKQWSWGESRSASKDIEGIYFNDLILMIIKMQHETIQNQQAQLLRFHTVETEPFYFGNKSEKTTRTRLSHNTNSK